MTYTSFKKKSCAGSCVVMTNTHITKLIASRLRLARQQAKLSQESLAEICGLATETISRIERCKYEPSLSTLAELARALNVSLSFFVTNFESSDDGGSDMRALRMEYISKKYQTLDDKSQEILLLLVQHLTEQKS